MPNDPSTCTLGESSISLCEITVQLFCLSDFIGWFRQCDLIPYSRDVDIGVWITDYKAQLIPSMQNAGLALIHVFGKVTKHESFDNCYWSSYVQKSYNHVTSYEN